MSTDPLVTANPELVIVGWLWTDYTGKQVHILAASDCLDSAELKSQIECIDDEDWSGDLLMAAPRAAIGHYTITAATRVMGLNEGGDPILYMVGGDTYAQALRRLMTILPTLIDPDTRPDITDIIADTLEVNEDDPLVLRLTEALGGATDAT